MSAKNGCPCGSFDLEWYDGPNQLGVKCRECGFFTNTVWEWNSIGNKLSETTEEFMDISYSDGYDIGYDKGYDDGCDDVNDVRYKEGFNEAISEFRRILSENKCDCTESIFDLIKEMEL